MSPPDVHFLLDKNSKAPYISFNGISHEMLNFDVRENRTMKNAAKKAPAKKAVKKAPAKKKK